MKELGEILFLSAIFTLAGAGIGAGLVVTYYQQQAIKRGYAQHNQKTGNWEWIEPTIPPIKVHCE